MFIAKLKMPAFTLLVIALGFWFMTSPKLPPHTGSVPANVLTAPTPGEKTPAASPRYNRDNNPAEAKPEAPYADLVQQKYAIVFSSLQLSPQVRATLQLLLQEREAIASKNFYDPSTNPAEVEENLRLRELAIAEQDERIAQLLSPDDAKKYQLLKDSTYEQALLNGFYQVAGMDSVAQEQKLHLLLGKLEQKQKLNSLIKNADEQIITAAPDTKKFLIEKAHGEFMAAQQEFLRNARSGLSEEQFQLLQGYEQQLGDERWGELVVGWE